MRKYIIVLVTLALVAATPANPPMKEVHPFTKFKLLSKNNTTMILEVFEVNIKGCSFFVADGWREVSMVHNPKCTNH